MNDTVDQLIECASLAGVSPSTLIDAAEQIRAVARRRLSQCEPKTSVQVIPENADDRLHPHAVPDQECASAEFVLVKPAPGDEEGRLPAITLTLQGTMHDVSQFMKAIGQAVNDTQPLQPMLDLLRGAKGKPLHVVCQLTEATRGYSTGNTARSEAGTTAETSRSLSAGSSDDTTLH